MCLSSALSPKGLIQTTNLASPPHIPLHSYFRTTNQQTSDKQPLIHKQEIRYRLSNKENFKLINPTHLLQREKSPIKSILSAYQNIEKYNGSNYQFVLND